MEETYKAPWTLKLVNIVLKGVDKSINQSISFIQSMWPGQYIMLHNTHNNKKKKREKLESNPN